MSGGVEEILIRHSEDPKNYIILLYCIIYYSFHLVHGIKTTLLQYYNHALCNIEISTKLISINKNNLLEEHGIKYIIYLVFKIIP